MVPLKRQPKLGSPLYVLCVMNSTSLARLGLFPLRRDLGLRSPSFVKIVMIAEIYTLYWEFSCISF